MGGSCSTQLAECNEKGKALEERIKLYESGVTDVNVHEMKSSQTNLGLVNVGVENSNNGDCECSSSIWGILEILATIVVVIMFLYMGYHCMVSYCNKRTRAKELERRNFMEMMEHRLRAPNDQMTSWGLRIAIKITCMFRTAITNLKHLSNLHLNDLARQIFEKLAELKSLML